MPSAVRIAAEELPSGNSSFISARISRLEVTRAAASGFLMQFPRARRSPFFYVRSSDPPQLSSWAVLHSSVVASRVCGKGRSESPSAAAACFECRLNSVSPDGAVAARRRGRNHRTLVNRAGEAPAEPHPAANAAPIPAAP